MEKVEEQHLLETEIFCDIINPFDQCILAK